MAYLERNYKISVNDIGSNGFCTKKAVLRFFETTACDHSDLAGCGILNIPETNFTWVLLQWKVQFLKNLRYGDRVRVETWARDTEGFTTYRDFKLINEKGELCAVATSKWALVDLNKGLIRIGDLLEVCYDPERKPVFGQKTLAKLFEPSELEFVFNYTVMSHDIDVNRHMHNLNYLDIATDALGIDEDYAFTEILYKTQCKRGDLLSVYKGGDENSSFVVIKNGEKLSSIIKFYY